MFILSCTCSCKSVNVRFLILINYALYGIFFGDSHFWNCTNSLECLLKHLQLLYSHNLKILILCSDSVLKGGSPTNLSFLFIWPSTKSINLIIYPLLFPVCVMIILKSQCVLFLHEATTRWRSKKDLEWRGKTRAKDSSATLLWKNPNIR